MLACESRESTPEEVSVAGGSKRLPEKTYSLRSKSSTVMAVDELGTCIHFSSGAKQLERTVLETSVNSL
jgi:hypothetical protein